MEVALEAGADDLERIDEYFEVTCDPKVFEAVRKALESHRIATEKPLETSYIPNNSVDLDVENGKRMLKTPRPARRERRHPKRCTPTTTSPKRGDGLSHFRNGVHVFDRRQAGVRIKVEDGVHICVSFVDPGTA